MSVQKNNHRIIDSYRVINDAVSSAELKERIMAMGLDPTGKSVAQMELMLGMAIFAQEHPGEEFPEQYSPMLAKDSSSADEGWIDSVYKSEDWIIQEKKNGMRCCGAECEVWLADGTKRRISDIVHSNERPKVLSFNEETGQIVEDEIVRVTVNKPRLDFIRSRFSGEERNIKNNV